MKGIGFKSAVLIFAMLPLHAVAAYQCNVSVDRVLVYSGGLVNVVHSGRGDYTMICNVSSEYQGVSPATCGMWTALLMAIKKKNGVAALYFEGNGSCATLPTYTNAPVPVYIGDVTP